MTQRALWLVGLNLLIPGSAQVLAGNRRIGRIGLISTFVLWGIGLLALLLSAVAHDAIYAIATNPVGLSVVQVALAAYVVIWVFLTLDTLRLVRLVNTGERARIVIAAFTILSLLATAGIATYTSASAGSARSAIQQIFAGMQHLKPVDGRYNVLLLGGDAGPDRTGLRPDSTSVASVDATTGATTIIGIPRNMERVKFAKGSPLYKPFPKGYNCGDKCLIDYLYTYAEEHPKLYPDASKQGSSPGVEAMKDAAEGVTGLDIRSYALIDMQGFADLIDALGGVTIDVPTKLAYGPVTTTVPYGYFEPGTQKMTGAMALWYGRSRFNGTDYDRMARQRVVQAAVVKEVKPATVLTKFQAIARAGAQVVKTDIPSAALPGLVDLADRGRKIPITDLELVPPMFDQNKPNYPKLHAAVQKAIAQSEKAATAQAAAAQ